MSKDGFAACSRLMLGCVCRVWPAGGGWTGGGPLWLLMGSVASSGSVKIGCPAEPGLRALSSFLGGVGACSAGSGSEGVSAFAPRGPRGSKASSPTSRRVAWTTLRAGAFLGTGFPAGLEGLAEGCGSISQSARLRHGRHQDPSVIPGDVFSFDALGEASRMLLDFEGTSMAIVRQVLARAQ